MELLEDLKLSENWEISEGWADMFKKLENQYYQVSGIEIMYKK